MNRVAYVLAGLLCIQAVAALALSFSGPDFSAYKSSEPLVSFNTDTVDAIEISEASGSSVTLMRSKDAWGIKEFAGFPADRAKVDDLLAKLRKLKTGWPVGETNDAAQRFKVAKGDFERRVMLKSGGKQVGDLYLGTSPAVRQTHARLSGNSEIYAVEFEAHEAAARGDQWLARDALKIDRRKVKTIKIGDIVLNRDDKGEFKLEGLGSDEIYKHLAIAKLVRSVVQPVFDAVDGKGEDALKKLDPPDATAELTMKDGSQKTIRYKAQDKDAKAYLFAPSGQDYLFRATALAVEDVVKAKRSALVEKKKSEDDTAKAGTPPAPKTDDATKPETAPKADASAKSPDKPADGQ